MASINQKKIFYENIKIEIENGQYLLEYMINKLIKALAKDLLTQEQFDELEQLTKEKVDVNYKENVTLESLEEKMINMELNISEVSLGLAELLSLILEDTPQDSEENNLNE